MSKKQKCLSSINDRAKTLAPEVPTKEGPTKQLGEVLEKPVSRLMPSPRNARTHSKKQITQVAASIERFGFVNPVLVTENDEIIAGHGRVEAAKLLGLNVVPTLLIDHLDDAERRAYILADNKLALNAGWDEELLALELQSLIDLEFEVELTGFSTTEIDFTIEAVGDDRLPEPDALDQHTAASESPPVCRMGDVWLLGKHRLLCGDARNADDFTTLMDGDQADLVFTDPPYNVKVDGNVCGKGAIRHREFAFASGEMAPEEFTLFLERTLGDAAHVLRDGGIAFVCMDWRHMEELLVAGRQCFTELKNLIVWNKTNGGMGTFYRSKHELIFAFKKGNAPHTNTFGLGDTGRYRTNVWDYPGISSVGASRADELAMHPTVKPAAMVADAIRDCSRRGEIILDCFGGSGTTLVAAEKTGRRARLIEYDPLYCDTIIRRWEKLTGKDALHQQSGGSFEEVAGDIDHKTSPAGEGR